MTSGTTSDRTTETGSASRSARDVLTVALYQERSGWRLPEEAVDRLAAAAGEGEGRAEVRAVGSSAELLRALPETTMLVGLPLSDAQLAEHGGGLRFVQLTESLGDAPPALISMLRGGARVAAAGPFRAPALAEHAVALTLSLTRGVDRMVLAQREHRWAATGLAKRARTLAQMRVGVIASSVTAGLIAERLAGFGAAVRGAGDDVPASGVWDAPPVSLDDVLTVLGWCEAAVVALPLTARTGGLFDRQAFERMGEGSFLVDVSRGGVVLQPALLEALRRGRLASAALDGFETTPLPANSPLWTMPNLIVSPSMAPASDRYWEMAVPLIAENVGRYRRGEALLDEVNAGWYEPRRRGRGAGGR